MGEKRWRKHKGGGGNAHDRAKARVSQVHQPQSPQNKLLPVSQVSPQVKRSRLARIIDFLEHGYMLAAYGIIGSVLALVYTPGLILIVLLTWAAIHRSKVVEGLPAFKVQIPAYLLMGTLMAAGLGFAIRKVEAAANITQQDLIEGLARKTTAWTTGGDSYSYFMLYDFDLQQEIAKQAVVIKNGQYPLYNAYMTITDADTRQTIMDYNLGEISGGGKSGTTAVALMLNGNWKLRPYVHYSISFSARNGVWHQDLYLRKSTKAQCWLAATRVWDGPGKERFEHIDSEYVEEFGNPAW
jgi:hypothetical protein